MKKYMVRLCFTAMLILLNGVALAQVGQTESNTATNDLSPGDLALFNDAVTRMVSSSYAGWSFEQTLDDGDDVMVERYDDTRAIDDRWTLITKNGKTPNRRTIKKYQKEKKKERREEEKKRGNKGEEDGNEFIATLVKPGTLKVFKKTDAHVTYSFRPQFTEEDEKEMEEFIFGEMTVSREAPLIEKIQLYSISEFSISGAKIKEFMQLINFSPLRDHAQSPVFIKSMNFKIKGRAMGLFGFDEQTKIQFAKYKKATSAEE